MRGGLRRRYVGVRETCANTQVAVRGSVPLAASPCQGMQPNRGKLAIQNGFGTFLEWAAGHGRNVEELWTLTIGIDCDSATMYIISVRRTSTRRELEMASIRNIETGKILDLEVWVDGFEMMVDIMLTWGMVPTEGSDYDFELEDDDFNWWREFAKREQVVVDTAEEMGEDAIEEVSRIYGYNNDLAVAQAEAERYLGIA